MEYFDKFIWHDNFVKNVVDDARGAFEMHESFEHSEWQRGCRINDGLAFHMPAS